MSSPLLSLEIPLRLAVAIVVFSVMAGWEMAHGVLTPRVSKGPRWLANLSLVAIDTVVVRLLLPAGLVGAALWVEGRGWGLFPALGLPRLLAAVLAVMLLDLAVYAQHVLFHAAPVLWRFHRVHHADHDVDVTTGLRFHPVEIVLSVGWKLVLVAGLGIPAEATLVFEILLNGTSIFNHANADLPIRLDRFLRLVLVTPDMHRIHHSVERAEHSSNFGFSLTWWDRMLGTYRQEPAAGRRGLRVGLPELAEPRVQGLGWLLALPWLRPRPGAEDVGNGP